MRVRRRVELVRLLVRLLLQVEWLPIRVLLLVGVQLGLLLLRHQLLLIRLMRLRELLRLLKVLRLLGRL